MSSKLSPVEQAYLSGTRQFTKPQQRCIRYRINKKLRLLEAENRDAASAFRDALAIEATRPFGHGTSSTTNIMFESEAHTVAKPLLQERGSPSLVGRGIANPQEYRLTANVVDFESYLKAQKKRNVRQIMSYAQRYYSVLETGDATPLASLQSGAVRRHAMEALAAYAKYNGSYDKWQQICQRYSLHWTNGDESFHALQRFFNSELSLDKMLSRLKEMAHKLPPPMGQIVRFGTLTGLRPAEILESVRLIIDDDDNQTFQKYYDSKQMVLRHWKFPNIFLRSTKKAFVSFVSPEIVQNVKINVSHIPSYSAIRHVCSRNGIACDLRFCRKVHGSWLHQHNVSAEEIDFLQGRTRTSVFTRHYLTPGDSLRTRVLDALKKLQNALKESN